MNLYRAIDRTKVQFDFLVHEQRVCDYDEEIKDLGGEVFRGLPRFKVVNYSTYRDACRDFFSRHPEHPVVHGHIGSCAPVYLREAKRQGRGATGRERVADRVVAQAGLRVELEHPHAAEPRAETHPHIAVLAQDRRRVDGVDPRVLQ